MSKTENLLEKIFIENNIPYQREYSFYDLKGKRDYLRFDFALFKDGKLDTLVEYDGGQHFTQTFFHKTTKSYLSSLERDRTKNRYCLLKKIKLIRIPYNYSINGLNFLNDDSLVVKSIYHNDRLRQDLTNQIKYVIIYIENKN